MSAERQQRRLISMENLRGLMASKKAIQQQTLGKVPDYLVVKILHATQQEWPAGSLSPRVLWLVRQALRRLGQGNLHSETVLLLGKGMTCRESCGRSQTDAAPRRPS